MAETPKRRGPKSVRTGRTLSDAVGEIRSHVVEREIRVGMVREVAHARIRRRGGSKGSGVTQRASDSAEQRLAIFLGN